MFGLFLRKKIKTLIVLAVLTLCCAAYLLTNLTKKPFIPFLSKRKVQLETFCYYQEGNELPYLDDKFTSDHHTIFFHETSCNGGLNSRQACAVEAAAKWNSIWNINVLFTSPVRNVSQKSFNILKQYKNINLYRINLDQYAKGTPLERTLKSGALNKTFYKVSHTSDFLRYLTLYKWGGVYLDLDTVVVKPLGSLALNWAARESEYAVAAGAMGMGKDAVGRIMALATVSDLANHWSGISWGANGPGVITRVLTRMCTTENIKYMNAASCQGFEVYPENYFYPIRWREGKRYFKPPTQKYPDTYVHHLWNHYTCNTTVHNDSLYAELAREHCPNVYKGYGDDFGSITV